MKLLIVIPYYEPAWAYGGPPRIISIIARSLAERHQVTVVTTDVYDGQQRARPLEETLGHVRILRFPTISNRLAWKTKIIIPRGLRQQIPRLVREHDVVLLSDFRHWLNATIAPELWRYHKPYLLAAFGQIQKPHDWKYLLKNWFDYQWGKQLVRRAHTLIAQTQHEVTDYQTLGGRLEQMHLMPLMETTPTAEEMSQRGEFRTKYQIPAQTKLLLFVGRINQLKGIDTLLKALVDTRRRLTQEDVRLVIVGRDDGYQHQLSEQIRQLQLQSAVIETGPLYGADNASCYLDADWFVFTPNHYEETSLAAVRALSFGLPVITTPQAELPWLDERQAGYTIQNEVSDLVDKLTEVLPNAILRTQTSSNATRLFSEHYERSVVIKQLDQRLADACQDNSQTIH